MSPSDETLLARWREGDKGAGDQLVRRHFDALFVFFRTKVESGHDDLIQSTFLAVVRGHEKFRGESSFRTFLFAIARNELLRSFRNKRRDRLVFDPNQESTHDLNPGPSTLVTHKAQQRLLLEALRRIPLDLQIALELHYWEALTTRELAAVLDIAHGTVKSRLRRAREALEVEMTKIAKRPDQIASTMSDLDAWAREIRDGAVGTKKDG